MGDLETLDVGPTQAISVIRYAGHMVEPSVYICITQAGTTASAKILNALEAVKL